MWTELVERAKEREARRESEREANEQLRLQARREFIDLARSELRGLLGALLDEMDVTVVAAEAGTGYANFRLRPWTWRPDLHGGFYGYRRASGAWYLRLHDDSDAASLALDEPIVPGETAAAVWLAKQQGGYEAAVDKRVQSLAVRLNPANNRIETDPEAAAKMRNEMEALRPERAAEWDALLAAWDADRQAKIEASVAAAAEQDAALALWRERLEEYRDESAAAVAHNTVLVEALRKRVSGATIFVREIEYAVVADDGEGRYVETRTAWATGSGDAWVTATDGRWRPWTYRHIVRVGEEKAFTAADPDAPRDLFLRRYTSGGMVIFPELFEREVNETLAGLRELPQEPQWEGPWSPAVGTVYNEALGSSPRGDDPF